MPLPGGLTMNESQYREGRSVISRWPWRCAAAFLSALMGVAGIPAQFMNQQNQNGFGQNNFNQNQLGQNQFGRGGGRGGFGRGGFGQNQFNQGNSFNRGGTGFGSNSQSSRERRSRSSRSNRNSANQRQESNTRNSTRNNTQRSRSREQRSNLRGGFNPFAAQEALTQGVPDRARLQDKSEVPRIRADRKKTAAATVGDFPKLELSPVIQSETLYFSPPDMKVTLNERFSTPILFYNPEEAEAEQFELWIRYNPELIEPVLVDTRAIQNKVAAPVEPEVWRSMGFIRVAGEFSAPQKLAVIPLVTISWNAIYPTDSTEIKFESPGAEPIGVFSAGENLLESDIGNEGIVSMQLKIIDPEAEEFTGIEQVGIGEDPFLPTEREGRGVHLALVPRDEMVLPGEVSTVDISLISPDIVPFDELRVRIRFDPEAVEILDADEGNYITEGINIYDGGFHEKMPFEFHGKNWVDPQRGIIEYFVGSSQGLRSYPSGTVARIVYRMKRDAGSTFFWFEGLDPLTSEYLSDVRARGRSLLGPETGRGQEALHNALVEVAPIS
jgi:hypothetical protein